MSACEFAYFIVEVIRVYVVPFTHHVANNGLLAPSAFYYHLAIVAAARKKETQYLLQLPLTNRFSTTYAKLHSALSAGHDLGCRPLITAWGHDVIFRESKTPDPSLHSLLALKTIK